VVLHQEKGLEKRNQKWLPEPVGMSPASFLQFQMHHELERKPRREEEDHTTAAGKYKIGYP
jgi:hypothetical protein